MAAAAACGGGSGETETPGVPEPGGRLAFVSFREGDQEIFAKDLPDGDEINLTNDPSDDFDPDISEDGSKVAFVSNRGGRLHIYVMGVDGGGVRLIDGTEGAQTPRWSRDGTKIAYSTGGAGVTVIDRDGGNARVLLKADGGSGPAP